MLSSIGFDPHRVDDNTREPVNMVYDIGTLHCSFDNGRLLGVVPCEDTFPKLTAEKLVEEQENSLDEVDAAPSRKYEASHWGNKLKSLLISLRHF